MFITAYYTYMYMYIYIKVSIGQYLSSGIYIEGGSTGDTGTAP